jgi:hypothetical protein
MLPLEPQLVQAWLTLSALSHPSHRHPFPPCPLLVRHRAQCLGEGARHRLLPRGSSCILHVERFSLECLEELNPSNHASLTKLYRA